MTRKIHIIATGGTIDSEYFPPLETSVPNKHSVIQDYVLHKIKPYADVSFETLFMLDSGNLTDTHRAQMVAAILATPATDIIICHGTNTMTETADYLSFHLKTTDKKIVLTGSMIPLKEFAMSDAGFNLGYAIAEVSHLTAGVYICMNARTFKAGAVVKNFELGRFEPKDS